MSTALAIEQERLKRRRKVLDAMRESIYKNSGRVNEVSGRVVPYTGIEAFSQLGAAIANRIKGSKLEGEEKAFGEKVEGKRSEALSKVRDAMTGYTLPEGEVGPTKDPDYVEAAMMAADPMLADNKALQDVTSELVKGKFGGKAKMPYQFFSTGEGIARGDRATGTIDYPENKILKVDADVDLAGKMSKTKELKKLEAQKELKPQVEAEIKAAELRAENEVETEKRQEGMSALIAEARAILENESPTSSGLGTILDKFGAFVGVDMEGAAPAAKLRVISGALTGKMPRFEGSQSNHDVEYYLNMAGRIGDSNTPIQSRLSALEIVSDIWNNPEKAKLYRKISNVPDNPEFVDERVANDGTTVGIRADGTEGIKSNGKRSGRFKIEVIE